MDLQAQIKKLEDAIVAGDILCASICAAELYAYVAKLFHKDDHPVMFALKDCTELQLCQKIRETVPAGMQVANDASASPWIQVLTPLLMALIQKLMDKLLK